MKPVLFILLFVVIPLDREVVVAQSVKPKQTSHQQTLNNKLLASIEDGNVAGFYKNLRRGAHVNAQGFAGTTALMTAALNGRTAFLAVLIARGARVNSKNQFGNTALIDAASFGEVEMVKWLLAAGANVRAKNESDWTALDFAAKSAYAKQENYQEVIRLLKAAGAKEH